MIQIAICDDDEFILKEMINEIEKIMKKQKVAYQCDRYTESGKLLEQMNEEKYNLLFLDIEMPNKDGFQVAQEIRRKFVDTMIIFISNYESKVFESYEYEPLWFIRKSDLKEMLPKAIMKFMSKIAEEDIYYEFQAGANKKVVKVKDIIFMECNLHEITVKAVSEDFNIYGSLKKLEIEFTQFGFIRIHKNYLVNRRYIFSVDSKNVILTNKLSLPLSKMRRQNVKNLLFAGESYDIL